MNARNGILIVDIHSFFSIFISRINTIFRYVCMRRPDVDRHTHKHYNANDNFLAFESRFRVLMECPAADFIYTPTNRRYMQIA